jgi:RNA polymerase sigma factor (sigma-70 family)
VAPTPQELLAHAAWLRRLAVSLVGAGGGAEDLVQDTWLAALRHPPGRTGPLRPWLSQVLRNFARMRHRADGVRRERRGEVERLELERPGPPSPEAMLGRLETERLLARLLAELAEPYRSTVLFRYSEGLTPSEIARHLGIPAATVRWRLKTGLDRLRAALDRESDGDRGRWRLALLPLVLRGPAEGTAGAALKGVFLMTRTQKAGAGIAVVLTLLFGVGVTFWLRAPRASRPASVPPEPRPSVSVAPPARERSARVPERPQQLIRARTEPDPGLVHGAFAGRVVNYSTGGGVAGAQVTFAAAGGSHTVGTDAQGGFAFEPPASGVYRLAVASAPGYLPFAPEWGTSPIAFTARPGLRIRDVIVFLTPAIDYVAAVVDLEGHPVAGADVRILDASTGELASFPIADRYVTDARGEVVFHARDGALLEARREGFAPGRARLGDAAQVSHRLTIALRALTSASAADGTLGLTGRVIDDAGAPVKGALVRAVHGDGALADEAHPDGQASAGDDGRFAIAGLDPGGYDVTATAAGCAPVSARVQAGGDVTLQLARGGTISGRAVDGSGQPVPAFTVVVTRRASPLREETVAQATIVDGDGHYEVPGLVRGDYRVRAAGDGHAPSAPVDAHVEPAEETADVQLVLRVGGSVRGRVVERGSGTPLTQARVSVDSSLDAGSSAVPLVTSSLTDAGGEFTLGGLEPGLRSVTAAAYLHNVQVRSGVAIDDGVSTGPLVFELAATKEGEEPKTEMFGIGAVLSANGDALMVVKVMAGGGAAAIGLREGDAILRVDGVPVTTLGMSDAIQRIRGPEGSRVALTVRRAADGTVGEVAAPRVRITY